MTDAAGLGPHSSVCYVLRATNLEKLVWRSQLMLGSIDSQSLVSAAIFDLVCCVCV